MYMLLIELLCKEHWQPKAMMVLAIFLVITLVCCTLLHQGKETDCMTLFHVHLSFTYWEDWLKLCTLCLLSLKFSIFAVILNSLVLNRRRASQHETTHNVVAIMWDSAVLSLHLWRLQPCQSPACTSAMWRHEELTVTKWLSLFRIPSVDGNKAYVPEKQNRCEFTKSEATKYQVAILAKEGVPLASGSQGSFFAIT